MKIYIAKLPDVFGFGYTAFSTISPDHARAKIQAHYTLDFTENHGYAPRDHMSDENFNEVFEYYGGFMKQLDLETVYCEHLDIAYWDIEDKELCAEERADKRLRRNAD